MALTVEVISKETIKPSSPTPRHLRDYKLSSLDQNAPLHAFPVILFYSAAAAAAEDRDNETNSSIRVDCLKKSLSEILPQFYPLAGRLIDNQIVDCNDQGVSFFEARVYAELNQVLHHPPGGEVTDQLIPKDNFQGPGPMVLLSVQANVFDCGGVAVGVLISHKLADACSLATFLGNWAALTRGAGADIVPPKFEAAALFPPKDNTPFIHLDFGAQDGTVVGKTFVLNAANIAALKAKCSENTTRVEAVSALIWKCAMKNKKKAAASVLLSTAIIAVNIRRRMEPPLSNSSFGNLVVPAAADVTARTDTCLEVNFLVGELRKEIQNRSSEYGVEGAAPPPPPRGIDQEKVDEILGGEVEICVVSSWCRLPFYGVDFGWGCPVWVGLATWPAKNCFVLLDTKCGQGVQVWASLEKQDMAVFESDPEFLAFTSTTTTD